MGRPETDQALGLAMQVLGSGLLSADHNEEALSVQEAEFFMLRRLGAIEQNILAAQSNLAISYERTERLDEAMRIRKDVYSGRLRLHGEEHIETLRAANNYAVSLNDLKHFGEARLLMRKWMPVARRVIGDNDRLMLKMRRLYAEALYRDDSATLDDLHEAATTLEDTQRIARRVLGRSHPTTTGVEDCLQEARAPLRTHETPPGSP